MNLLPFTCTGAFQALNAWHLRELEQENSRLRVALFNASMPKFKDVICNFNDSKLGPQCNCAQCHWLGLVRENWCQEDGGRCKLWTAWDDMLARLNVSVDDGNMCEGLRMCVMIPPCQNFESADLTLQGHVRRRFEDEFEYRDCNAAVVKMHGRWTSRMCLVGAWGRPIDSMDDPRVEEWQRIFVAVEQMS